MTNSSSKSEAKDRIAVLNYGIGNLGSVMNMLKRVGLEAELVSEASHLKNFQRFILPGVGHFDACAKAFKASGLLSELENQVLVLKKPILGICVGFHLLTASSEEGRESGLGWLDAKTLKFKDKTQAFKIPHMGWNTVDLKNENFFNRNQFAELIEPRFYFVHSYYVSANNQSDVVFEAHYINPFAAAMKSNNIVGIQFHPEKSHRFGMAVFKQFSQMEPS